MSKKDFTATPGCATYSYYIFLIIYAVGLSAFGSFVNDLYTPCLPEMVKVFNVPVARMQLSLTFGMIGLGAGEIIFGPISDKYGRKPVLIFSLVLFLFAAGACIFSRTLEFFLICRLFQGIAASVGYFLARTIPADIFQGYPLARFMSVIGAINGLAPASAPVLGGFLDEFVDWKGVFGVLCILVAVLLLFSRRLKESLPPDRRLKGNLLEGYKTYIDLIKNKPFIVHALLKGSALGIVFTYVSTAPYIFQTHYGYSPVQYGMFIAFNALFIGLGAFVTGRFKRLKTVGFWASVGVFAILSLQWAGLLFIDSFWMMEILFVPMLFCEGMLFTVSNTLAMNEGRQHAGAASAMVGVTGYIFGAVAAPLAGRGDIMHSTAWVFIVIASIVLTMGIITRNLKADLDTPQSPGEARGSGSVDAQQNEKQNGKAPE